LTILGEGSEKLHLQNQIYDLRLNDRVSLPGFSHNPYKYMEQSDVFISSSRFEGFPNVVIEALFCGTPVIANNYKGGINEILQYSEFGVIINIENFVDLQYFIDKYLYADRNKIKRLAMELYSKEKMLDIYETIFTKL
jgi:glycosyltransferase involved in cell wall biosynthesis